MGARKPLTEREKYLASRCQVLREYKYDVEGGRWKEKPVSRTRALLKARANNNSNDRWREFFTKMKEGFNNLEEFLEYKRMYEELDKYQGYLYGNYVYAEMEIEGLSEEEIRRLNVMEAI